MKKKKRRVDKDGYEYDFDGVRGKDLKIIKSPEWLPTPAEVAETIKKGKITIVLDNHVIQFFKHEADERGVSYQQMIREILRKYKEQMKRAA